MSMALRPLVPVEMKSAMSSALERAPGPRRTSFSRGRSPAGRSLMRGVEVGVLGLIM